MCGQESNLHKMSPCAPRASSLYLSYVYRSVSAHRVLIIRLSTQSRIGVFDSFTSTFPCRWALSYCQVYACRLVQCRQLFLNTNQFPSCREHPVSPDLCYWVGIEPTLMDRYGIEPYSMEQRQSYIHKLWPLCASYPFEYYPPFGSINRLTQTQEPFVPRKHVTSDNMFFKCSSAFTSTTHLMPARAVQGQPISPIRTSCATTYRIEILMVLMPFPWHFGKLPPKLSGRWNSLHFSFALSRKYKSSIYCHNYFMSEYQRRFLSQQSFTAYRAAFTLSCQMGQEPKPPGTFEVPLITAIAVGGERWFLLKKKPNSWYRYCPYFNRVKVRCITFMLIRFTARAVIYI